jgi:hypothetical protein
MNLLLGGCLLFVTGFRNDCVFWPQWAHDPQHTGMVGISAQPLNRKISDIVYDHFVEQEKAENAPFFGAPTLTVHYQSTLVDGESFYMVQKDGPKYPSCSPVGNWQYGDNCGPNAWNQLQWSVVRYDWIDGKANFAWKFLTDWKPEPNASDVRFGFTGLAGWEPVFHPTLANGYLYVPGAAGAIWKVDKGTGKVASHLKPVFGKITDSSDTFVSGPLTADEQGDIYYNVIQLNVLDGNPWNENDVADAWLVKITRGDNSTIAKYSTLVPNAPSGESTNCPGTFFNLSDGGVSLPWPPSKDAVAPTQLCGSQRPGVNVAPAIGGDGTIYTVSVAHFDALVAYVVAVNPDLTTKWTSTLQKRLTDGCGVLLPIAQAGNSTEPNSCRYGTTKGVDPTTNTKGSGIVSDDASSTPTVLPDGSVLFGALDNYNYGRGHLFHFDSNGKYLSAYPFGWDSTAAVYKHEHTFSIVIKDNLYQAPAYCYFSSPVCTPLATAQYLISQLNSDMEVEWSFQSTTFDSNHVSGYEWCVNAPVIDSSGLVYVNSEDGSLYSLPQGHKGLFRVPHQKIFLKEALGAAYTPLSIGGDGKVYSQNDGHLFVIGR